MQDREAAADDEEEQNLLAEIGGANKERERESARARARNATRAP